MPGAGNHTQSIRESHRQQKRPRRTREGRGNRRGRRWTPSDEHGLQRFFPEWPIGHDRSAPLDPTPAGAGAGA
jgi:hypothetical protein